MSRLLILAASLLALAGCGGAEPAPRAAEAAPTATSTPLPARQAPDDAELAKTPEVTPKDPFDLSHAKNGVLPPGAADRVLPVGSQPLLRVTAQGGEPRSELSYALKKGAAAKMGMNIEMTMGMKSAAATIPEMSLPVMTMAFDMKTVDETADPRSWKIRGKLTKVTAVARGPNDKIASAMQSQLKGMTGFSMVYTLHPNGRVQDVSMDIPKTTPDAAKQMMQGMGESLESTTTILPSEPIGIGARWDVLTRISTGGSDLLQVASYTLRERDRSKATLDVTVKQVAATDVVKNPALPGVARITSFSSSGAGNAKVDTSSIVTDASEVSVRTAMTVVSEVGGQRAEVAVDTAVVVHLGRR